jgi:ribonuclease P protein component
VGNSPEAASAKAVAAARFLFGKERRIRKRAEFLHVQQAGLRATSKHFVLLIAAGPSSSAPSRIGIVATKKVGDATQRNRIKRLCRECFRLWPDFLPDGVDLVVIAREGADALTLEKVRGEWGRAHAAVLGNCKKALAAGFVGAPKRERAAARGSATASAPRKEPKSS